MSRVAVFGLGYVGCVTAGCLSQDGHDVIGVDVDPAKVGEINDGFSPISEPGLDEIVAAQVKAGRLRATDNAAEAVSRSDMALIAVGTPSAEDGSVTVTGVEAVMRSIGKALGAMPKPYRVIVRSTLLPGILEESLEPVLKAELGPAAAVVELYNNPEFLRESSAVKDYYHPPYILVGTVGSALFWTTTQLLTVSSSFKNPISSGGRILDVFMEAYAIIVIATLAGALGAFLQKRGLEIEAGRH
jgi:GDP-mannose 6-dehydrogenase